MEIPLRAGQTHTEVHIEVYCFWQYGLMTCGLILYKVYLIVWTCGLKTSGLILNKIYLIIWTRGLMTHGLIQTDILMFKRADISGIPDRPDLPDYMTYLILQA